GGGASSSESENGKEPASASAPKLSKPIQKQPSPTNDEEPAPPPKQPKAAAPKAKKAAAAPPSESSQEEEKEPPAPKAKKSGGGKVGGGGGETDLMSLEDAVLDVKRDTTDTNWCLFSYSKQTNGVVFEAKGSGGHEEFMENLDDGKVQYGLL